MRYIEEELMKLRVLAVAIQEPTLTLQTEMALRYASEVEFTDG